MLQQVERFEIDFSSFWRNVEIEAHSEFLLNRMPHIDFL